MLKHHLRLAIRMLRRERGYTAINVVGLGLGVSVALLLALYVRTELTFARFHANADRIQRLWLEEHDEGETFLNVVTPLPLADRIEADIPEVEHVVQLYDYTTVVRHDATQLSQRIHLAGPDFFDVFDFPLERGDRVTALADPHAVVLTASTATTFFGREDPLGQTLDIRLQDEVQTFTVTAVAEDPPAASSVRFGILIPFTRSLGFFPEQAWEAWQQVYPETYVLLPEGVSAEVLDAKLAALVQSVRPNLAEDDHYVLHSQPLPEIHLNGSLPAGLEPTGNPAYPTILSGIALFILLIACVNFMTLAVSRSVRRAKEVGVRKAVGAGRGQLMRQFWSEAAVVTGLALVAGVVLTVALLPAFNRMAGTDLSLRFGAGALGFVVVLAVVIAFVAGSYPAIVLARFRPVDALRGQLQVRGDRSLLRRGLVVVQFALATFLVASTLLMVRQMTYLQTRPLGFEREQVVVLPTTGGYRDGLAVAERVRTALLSEPGVVDVAPAAFRFSEPWAVVGYDADDGTYREVDANFAGLGFVETMGIRMAAGRAFSHEIPADTARGLLVNEALVRAYGWTPEAAVGQRLPGPFPDHEILGVTEDFHYTSLHSPVGPVVIVPKPDLLLRGATNVDFNGDSSVDVMVRLGSTNVPAVLDRLKAVWEEAAPEQPFAFSFLDATLDAQYRQEQRLVRIVGVAAGLAVFIACLGLLGLAALTAERRRKEVGVRKVLGASVADVVGLLTRDFAWLVGLGFAVAVPAAWWAAERWLDGFAYQVGVGPAPLVVAGVLTLSVALATVAGQALRAATADPVRALRSE